MIDEIVKSDSALDNQQKGTDVDYIQAINELKENTVSKEKYDKLVKEQQDLLSKVINGEQIQVDVVDEKPDLATLRKELFAPNNGLNNLEYCKKALQLRDGIIAEGGVDPFLPFGRNITPTEEDIILADRVAQVMQECIDVADGDSIVFTNELQRRTIDANIRRK